MAVDDSHACEEMAAKFCAVYEDICVRTGSHCWCSVNEEQDLETGGSCSNGMVLDRLELDALEKLKDEEEWKERDRGQVNGK